MCHSLGWKKWLGISVVALMLFFIGMPNEPEALKTTGQLGENNIGGLTKPPPVADDKPASQSQGIRFIQARVSKVIDGDTIEVIIGGKAERVRLIGVDTPETHHPRKPVEPYGIEAENFTRSRLSGAVVYLEKDISERDKYGRLLAYVWVDKPDSGAEIEVRSKMYNARLLLEGFGQILTIPPDVKYTEILLAFQREARAADKGLWGKETQGAATVSGPKGETIKGNINSKGEKIYHVPGGNFYAATVPEGWFFTEEEARIAGYRRSLR
ncbi:MAG: thermonuclease family protein [Desulfocucumaceae bacterium]